MDSPNGKTRTINPLSIGSRVIQHILTLFILLGVASHAFSQQQLLKAQPVCSTYATTERPPTSKTTRRPGHGGTLAVEVTAGTKATDPILLPDGLGSIALSNVQPYDRRLWPLMENAVSHLGFWQASAYTNTH